MRDPTNLNPFRPGLRRALHEKELADGAIRIALHYHGPIMEVGQQELRHISVVLKQISFGYSELWPEEFLEIGQLDGTIAKLQFDLVFFRWQSDFGTHPNGWRCMPDCL
jgi:hypothetical protein